MVLVQRHNYCTGRKEKFQRYSKVHTYTLICDKVSVRVVEDGFIRSLRPFEITPTTVQPLYRYRS